jgi:hypothetical protein
MDAVRLFALLRPMLEEVGARWMLAGGFALAAYGSSRVTHDLDLLVDDRVRDALLHKLMSAGFELYNDAAGFSNLDHVDRGLGRLDILWVEGDTCRRLFEAAGEQTGPDALPVLVPAVEHLVEMKLEAIRSRPTRALRDGLDLQFLVSLPQADQNRMRVAFERKGLRDLWDRIRPAS